MGLDAVVECNCLVRGVAHPAPVPVHIGEDGWLGPVDAADWERFERWQKDCCAHPALRHTSVRIGNWAMYRSFQEALEEAGPAHFPTLARVLPGAAGGQVLPVDARACLIELSEFRRRYQHERPALVDARTGEALDLGEEGIFARVAREGVDLGFDAEGLFVVPAGTRAAIFQARRVELRADAGGGSELVDLDTGASWLSRQPLPVDELIAHPLVEVRASRRTAADHEIVLKALEQVFRASIEIGNPVVWC